MIVDTLKFFNVLLKVAIILVIPKFYVIMWAHFGLIKKNEGEKRAKHARTGELGEVGRVDLRLIVASTSCLSKSDSRSFSKHTLPLYISLTACRKT